VTPDLTYAIGDIHGCHDLLLTLLGGIEEHAGGRSYRLVFLGDYIDRGPDSAGVIRAVRQLQQRSPETVTCLKGNHEQLLVEAAHGPNSALQWLYNGGDAALRSFRARGLDGPPAETIEWARQLPTFYEDERHYYVHAGLDPTRPLHDQTDHDRIWIRGPFLNVDHDFGKHVVHGHTPQRSGLPEERRYRTNLDTAAVYGGALTAGVFTADQDQAVAFLRVAAEESF
jgi:serine/threonine protein phosphatase 1